jgi:hypothetical protein
MADFPSTPLPEYPIEEMPAEPDVLISTHRDGSEQRRLKGGGKLGEFGLRWGSSMPLTKTERDALLNHWTGQNGTTTSFNFRHPERTTEVTVVRYAGPYSFRLVAYNCYEGEVRLKVVTA